MPSAISSASEGQIVEVHHLHLAQLYPASQVCVTAGLYAVRT